MAVAESRFQRLSNFGAQRTGNIFAGRAKRAYKAGEGGGGGRAAAAAYSGGGMRRAEGDAGCCADGEAVSGSSGGGDGGRARGGLGPSWAGRFQRDLAAGALMGGLVHTVVAPIERAKILLQTQEGNEAILGLTGRARRDRFRGMLDCIVRTVREEGVLSLWRGNGTSVLRYYPSVALNFSLKVLVDGVRKREEQRRKILMEDSKGREAEVENLWLASVDFRGA